MQLLVSINSVFEANLVLSAGVGIIDLKDTSSGALSMLDIGVSQAIMQIIQQQRHLHPSFHVTVSATIGDTCPTPQQLQLRIEQRLQLGVDIIKLPATIWLDPVFDQTLQTSLDNRTALIAVFSPAELTEHEKVKQMLADLSAKGYFGVMVDTIDKNIPVTQQLGQHSLQSFIQHAKSHDLYVGVAGGLQTDQIPSLLAFKPDYIGLRGGLCEKNQSKNSLSDHLLRNTVEKMSDICQ